MTLLPMLSSWTVWGILIITLMVTIHTTEAALGDNCTVVADCGYDGATCDGGVCGCDTAGGYRVENNQCLPNAPSVTLTGPSTIVLGQDATLSVSIISGPVPTSIVWQKVSDGATTNITIDSTKFIQTGALTSGSVTLTIKSVTFDEEATYQVKVSNSVGPTTSSQLALDVTGERPTVSVSGPTQSGTSVTIVCSATVVTSVSPAITTIQWTKNGNPIDIAGSNGKYTGGSVSTPSLTITSITTTDKGVYRCTATNLVGSTTSTSAVTLDVPNSVSLTGPPSTMLGQDAAFTASVISDPVATGIVWQKVSGSTPTDITIDSTKFIQTGALTSGSVTLTIKSLTFDDEATYQVKVSNSVGQTTSNQVALDVTGIVVSLAGPPSTTLGQDAEFTASFTSDPVATGIIWQKVVGGVATDITIDSTKFIQTGTLASGSVTLTIKSVTSGDETIYQVKVLNSGGQTTSNQLTLDVKDVPTVNLAGPSTIVLGQDAEYTATITSDPVATGIVWQKVSGGGTSDITIDSTKFIQTGTLTSGSVTLTIKSVTFNDEATYQVKVSNSVGHKTSNQVALDVTGDPPTVSVSGPTQSGASVTIGCTATVTSASPAITAIQWTKDNTAIDIAGSNGKYTGGSVSTPSLTITSIATTDKGDYKCTATNLVGSTTSTSAVTLASPTVSVTGASSVLYGNAVTFTGTVISNLPWTAQKWQKVFNNGTVVDININDGSKYSGSSLTPPNPKLQISNTDFTDEAKYQLVVNNGVGRATSNQVSLDVTGDFPTVSISGGSAVVFGSSITFTGTISSSPPASVVTWQKVDSSQTVDLDINDQKYSGSSVSASSPRLVINNAAFTDTAIYQLTVTNLVGKKTSIGINLTVTGEKPTITINFSGNTVSVVYGKTATLTATVTTTSDSPPTLNGVWQKQMSGVYTDIDIAGDKYKDSTNDVNSPTLKINNAVYTDEGAYRFTASNLVGTTVSTPRTVDVTGTEPTVTISANPSSSIQFGTTLNITASVTANPPANSSKWQRRPQNGAWSDIDISGSMYDGSSVTPSAPLLVIPSITYSEDNATFRCVVGNPEGETTSDNITIDVTGNLPTVSVTPIGPVQLPYNTTLTSALVATVTAGSNTGPAQEVRWRKITSGTGVIIDISSSKYSGSTNVLINPQLVINNAVFGDEAEYQCQARNAEGWGSSNKVSVDVTGGNLTVTTGPAVEGKIGESVTILCTVTGPEVSLVVWKRGGTDISIDGTRYTGSTPSSPSLIINSLIMQDADQYLCTASNPGGTYSSPTNATLTVINRQFQDSCSASLPCDSNKELQCSKSKCVCKEAFYHNNNLCYSSDRLKVTISSHSSTTSTFTVSWNPPSNDANLVSGYTVKWRVHDQADSTDQSQTVDKSLTSHTVSTGLIPGQLYIVTVMSDVTLIDPASTIQVRSDLEYIRIVPLRPGSILDSSDFAADKLMLSWTAPISNTVVTKYEVTIDGTTQSTAGSNANIPNIQFTKQLVPGTTYTVSIVTVSGQNINNDEEKKSVAYTEDIRTTPKKPGPPTGVTCPAEPKDKSLEISWTATATPNGRILSYIITVKQSGTVTKTVDTLINVTTFDVTGLLEERSYTFTVQTVNDAVNSTSDESTPAATCKTKAGLSTPPTALTIGTPSSRGFPVSFGVPTDVKGKLAGYRILIKDGSKCWQQIKIFCDSCTEFTSTYQGCSSNKTHQVPNIAVTQNYNVTHLHPYINYTFEVAAINGAGVGNSAEKTIMTEEEVPKQPSITNVTPKSDKAVELTWTLAPPSPGNVTYTVTVMEEDDNTSNLFIPKKEIQYNGFEQTVKVIDGLEEYWRYKFIVRAATIKGSKMSDELAITRTKQGVPGKVRDLKVKRKPNTYRAALVQWKVPSLRDQNGILVNYKFIFKNDSGSADKVVPVNTNEQFVTQEEIIVVPEITYSVEIYAINSEGTNGENENFTYTAAAGPPPHTPDIDIVQTAPGQHSPSQTTIEIGVNTDFFTNKENGEPVYFGIAACASCGDANFAGNGQQEYKNLPDWYAAKSQGFPLYRVTNESYMQEVKSTASGRRKRSTDEPFVIGEDNTCETQGANAYCNGPLSPGLSYTVIIFVCTNGGCTKSGDIGPFATLKVPDEPTPIGGIVGGVVAAVVAVGVVAVAMFIVKRRRGRNPEHKYQKNIEEKGEDLSETPLKNIPRKRPIKLKDLAEKVADKHKDSNLYFAREYEDLKTLSPKHPTETSELDNNKLKNRYVNILPFDHSRVKLLLTEDDDPSTDFINANYLPGYKSEREYIATQGPIPGTIDDFWRMIWEQNVSIIVMLTLCKEDGRVKCEMYWPENMKEPKQYGDLVVETVSCSTVNFYDFRIFKMKLGDSTRTLKHFHFLQWKDFSANVQNDVMIDFIRNVRNHIRPPDMNGPVVVHCSAGVGRTGTYCALDHLFQVIDDRDLDYSIDIFDLVLNLREQRMFMVQTEQQYIFIHDCLKEFLDKKRKELEGGEENLYENQAFVSDEPAEESLYQNYSNQRTDL